MRKDGLNDMPNVCKAPCIVPGARCSVNAK